MKYGFDRLLFNWGYTFETQGKIDEKTCDVGNYYCDQTQLYRSINAKFGFLNINDDGKIIPFSKNHSVDLNGIIFKLDAQKNIEKLNPLYDVKILDPVNITDNSIESYLNASVSALGRIPQELRKLTIIKVNSDNLFVTGYDDFINKLTQNTSYPNSMYKNGTNYFFTVDTFYNILKGDVQKTPYDNLKNITKCDDVNLSIYLNKMLSSMDIYVGVGLNEFLADLKQYGLLTDNNNKTILDGLKNVTTVFSNISINSINGNVDKPGIYLVKIIPCQKGNTQVSQATSFSADDTFFFDGSLLCVDVNIIKVNDSLRNVDFTNNELLYSKNPLFYNPINADVVSTSPINKIPFGFGAKATSATLIEPYNNWDNLQKGYIFEFKDNSNISFFDSRLIKLSTSSSTSGNILKYNLLRNNTIFKKDRSSNNIFVMANDLEQTINDTGHQIIINSTTSINCNAYGFTLSACKSSLIELEVPKILDTTIDHSNVDKMVQDILTKKACFNINTDTKTLQLWNNLDTINN